MALFLPGGSLVDTITQAHRIGEFLQREFDRMERWGCTDNIDNFAEMQRAVRVLVKQCAQARQVTDRLHSDPLVYTGEKSTEDVLATLDQIWPHDKG